MLCNDSDISSRRSRNQFGMRFLWFGCLQVKVECRNMWNRWSWVKIKPEENRLKLDEKKKFYREENYWFDPFRLPYGVSPFSREKSARSSCAVNPSAGNTCYRMVRHTTCAVAQSKKQAAKSGSEKLSLIKLIQAKWKAYRQRPEKLQFSFNWIIIKSIASTKTQFTLNLLESRSDIYDALSLTFSCFAACLWWK